MYRELRGNYYLTDLLTEYGAAAVDRVARKLFFTSAACIDDFGDAATIKRLLDHGD